MENKEYKCAKCGKITPILKAKDYWFATHPQTGENLDLCKNHWKEWRKKEEALDVRIHAKHNEYYDFQKQEEQNLDEELLEWIKKSCL